MSGLALLSGWAADQVLGDPRRWHPVAGFGRLALALERTLYAPSRARGALYAGALVALAALGAEAAARVLPRRLVLAACTWAALGGRSLAREADAVAADVRSGDLGAARKGLPALVGRDPDALDADGICRATVESVAENTADAVVGVLLWGAHMAMTQGIFSRMIADSAPDHLRATSFGAFWFVTGIATLLASLAAGLMWDREGPQATFFMGAAAAGAALAMLSLLQQPRRDPVQQ